MMKQLKCYGYLKLLKQSFIILGISCFTFLVNSSVKGALDMTGNSYYGDLGTPFTEGLYTYEITPNLNFTSEIGTSSFDGFYWQSSYWGSSPYEKDVIGWVDGNLYAFLGNVGGSNDNDLNIQGFYDKWCVVPVSVNPGVYNSVYGCEGKFTTSISDILEFKPNFTNFTIEKVGFSSPSVMGGVLQLCFKDSSNYYCVACSPGNCPSGLTGSKNYVISNMDFSTFVNFPFSNSPFGLPTPEFSYTDLNNYNTLYQSYLRKGFKDVLCYGGYGLNDLYVTGSNLSGLQVGSGATVFDLYHEYGSGYKFPAWYSKNDSDFIYFDSFRDSYESQNFIGKSKGLIGLGMVKKIYRKSESPLLSQDLQIFCNIVINHSDEINQDTWVGGVFDDYIDQSKLNQLIGDIGVVVPISGTPLDYLWNQYMSGSSSFTGCDSPEECITKGGIDKSVDLAWKTWSIEGLRGNITGILPWYIVFGFLGIMFLYYLRR